MNKDTSYKMNSNKKYLYYFKMAKEMSVTCDFIQHNLHCVLPEKHNGYPSEGLH